MKTRISFNVKINVKLARVTNTDGKEVTLTVQLQFIDSCWFVESSLEKLVFNLDDDQCKNFTWLYTKDEVSEFVRCKGIYPGQCMDSWEKFEEKRYH